MMEENKSQVEIKFNNMASHGTCPVCGVDFKPLTGLWPFVKGGWVPVCEPCSIKLDGGARELFRLMNKPNPINEIVRELPRWVMDSVIGELKDIDIFARLLTLNKDESVSFIGKAITANLYVINDRLDFRHKSVAMETDNDLPPF